MINILHMSPWPLGGATSYVVNLAKTFERAKVPYRIARLANKTERTKRPLGSYGVSYQNVAFADAVKGKGTWLLASAPTDPERAAQAVELLGTEGFYTFHDPNEFRIYPHWNLCDRKNVICIRETGLASMPDGVFIPHPYVRVLGNRFDYRTNHAVSIARTSAVKNSDWILEANTRLPPKLQVELRGELNRMWWKFNVESKHPEWKKPENTGFVREHGVAAMICSQYNYMVDLTIFGNDGGGTQYSLLEAIDAGAVPIMSADWCGYPGPAQGFGWAVGDTTHLARLLGTLRDSPGLRKQTDAYRKSNYDYLDTVHKPERIAKAYTDALGV